MIDSHCHLDREPLINNFEEVMQRAKNVGIEKILTICTTNKNFSEIENLVKKDQIIYGTFGIHPHEANNNSISKLNYLVIPLNLSDRRLKSSALTRIKVDNTIKHVATAKIVGLNCSLRPVHICIGIVVFSKPARNNTTTTSSNDVTNANNPPEITPGKINGSVIFIKVFTGLLPRLEAALVTL